MPTERGASRPGNRRPTGAARRSRSGRAGAPLRGSTGPGASRPERQSDRGRRPRSSQSLGQRRAHAVLRSPLTRQIVALGLALCAVALSLAYPLRGYLAQQAAEAEALAEQQQLQTEIDDRLARLTALKDPAYVRSEAKRRLQYVMPGDTVYVMKLPAAGAAGDEEQSSRQPSFGYDDPLGGTPTETEATPWYATLWDTVTGDDGVR